MPNGWIENPNGDTPGWWLWAGSDAAKESNWTQIDASDSPPGFDPDVNNPGWYFNGGNPQNLDDWWHDQTVADEPMHQVIDIPGVPHRSSREGRVPIAIVIHTMSGTLAGCDSWFRNPASQVSAHYGVDLSGEIHQYVGLGEMAWANGRLEPGNTWPLQNGVNPNKLTISIETEDRGSGATPVTNEMYESVLWLCQQAVKRYPSIRWLITHHVISPLSRPSCPGVRWTNGRIQNLAAALKLQLLL